MIRTTAYIQCDGLQSGLIAVLARSAQQGWHGYPFCVYGISGDGPIGSVASRARTIALCIEGEGLIEWQHGSARLRQDVRKGMAWLSWHGYASGQAHWSGRAAVLELQMEASRRPATREPLRSEKHGILLPFEDEGLVALLMAMRSEVLRGCPSGPAFATNLSAALAAHIAAAYPERLVSGSTSTLSEKDLRRLCDYIDEHLARSLVVDDLAALFGLGTSQFSRRLKASTGMSPHQFLTQRRMDRAHGLLLQSHTLADVARAVGIPNPSHFIQVFRRQTGITPGQARTTLRSLPVESSSKDVLNA